ncbi:MAG: EAL domain-containing protein [Woeseia sp.]
MQFRPNRHRLPWPLIAVAALALAALAANSDFGQRLEHEFADSGASLLLHEVESDVVIVGIDARSLSELQDWPWPRRYHADLINRIATAAPRRLFLDIDFSSRSNAEDDQLLESALATWKGEPVVLPAFYQQASASERRLLLTEPLPRLRRHAVLGSVNLLPSEDGLVRSMQTVWDVDGRQLPAAAALLHGLPQDSSDPRQWIDFTIDPASFRYLSFIDVLANGVSAEHFAGMTVFVGATAVELGDMIAVPLHQSLPGVVVQALAYETLRNGPPAKLRPPLYWLALSAAIVLLTFLFGRQSWQRNVLVTVLALAAVACVCLYSYTVLNTILPVVPAAIAIALAYLLSTLRSLQLETLRALSYALGFRKRDALLKSIVLSSSDCIVCIAATGKIMTANPAATALFACPARELQGCSIFEFLPSLADGRSGASRFGALSGDIAEYTARTKKGDEFPVELSLSRVRFREEELYTAIVRDISERKAQQHQLQFQATHDPLTTLPNRPALAARLDSVLAQRDAKHPVALMMIDLDRFKEVNDTLGHNVGDYVLYEVARRLQRIVGERGFIARIGGDEFALVVENFAGLSEISALSQELVDSLKRPVETCGIAIDVGLSVGIALYPQDAADAETLFKHSDVAMYVAKRSGSGSGFEYYDTASNRHSVRKLSILSRLRTAIAEDQLQLHYQPQVNLATGRVESVEALLRWEDASLGAVRPDEFVQLAETTDLNQSLCRWTLVRAFEQSVAWRRKALEVRIAINVSARVLQDVRFPRALADLMQEAGVSTEHFELEITESAMMLDPQRAGRVIRELSDAGIMISVDDYGTGYSSLAYLRDLAVHSLKLDKSFVMNMQQHDHDRVIVESTAQMARALNLKVVAEGVETGADAVMLRDAGYDYGQGYWYSPALPPQELANWVRKFNATASPPDVRRLSL